MKKAREDKMEVLKDKEDNAKNEENERENSDPPMLSAVASTSVEQIVGIGERMEQKLQQFRQQGAIQRRVVLQQRAALAGIATSARALSRLQPMPPGERSGGVGQAEDERQELAVVERDLGEAERQSREAEQELREYLRRDSHSASLTSLLDGVLVRRPGSPQPKREGPDGAGAAPVFQEPEVPPEYQEQLPPSVWMPVPHADPVTRPMEWDDDGEISETEAMGVPTMVVRVTVASGAVSPRRRRRRARPYNPRRHLELDDYVPAHLLTPPRTPSPPSAPIRRPLSPRSRVRELDRRQQDQDRELQERSEERVRRDLPARPARELAVSPTKRE